MHELINVRVLVLMMLLSVTCAWPWPDKRPVRKTTNGPIEGTIEKSSLGEKYYAFKGVPYAETPITGKDPYTYEMVDRRFKAPEPLKRTWTNNLKVHEFGYSCFNSSKFDKSYAKRSEDCLSLNIYVPGGFTEGEYTNTFFGPDFLLSEDNIVVTIQYRVGIFGFLNLGTSEYSGNMGLKDQQLALKWVYENIENFSGNKDEILLFGESAGGASVIYHMLNEESRKYFNRVLAMSGSPFDYFALTKEDHFERMQECTNTTDLDQIVEYLKSTENRVLAQCYFDNWGEILLKPKWVPTIERSDVESAFMTQSPNEIYHSDKSPAFDVLFGFVSQEAIAFDISLIENNDALIQENVEKSLVQLPFDGFNEKKHPKEFKEALEKLKDAYYSKTTDVSTINRANIALLSDLNLNYNILKNIFHQIKANTKGDDKSQHKKTFLFRFSKSSVINLYKGIEGLEYDGATHGDELCYFFHCHVADELKLYDKHLRNKTSEVYKSIMQMVRIITNFARTGDPTIEGDTQFKPSTSEEIFCLEIDNDSKSNVTTNIAEQLHYETWNAIEETYKSLKGHASVIQLYYGND